MTRKRIDRYKRRKPGGKYKTVQVKSYLRKRERAVSAWNGGGRVNANGLFVEEVTLMRHYYWQWNIVKGDGDVNIMLIHTGSAGHG